MNWRARGGLRLQGGTSTGRQVTDICEIRVDDPSQRNCHVALPFQTNVRGSASYVIPKVDVLREHHLPAPPWRAAVGEPHDHLPRVASARRTSSSGIRRASRPAVRQRASGPQNSARSTTPRTLTVNLLDERRSCMERATRPSISRWRRSSGSASTRTNVGSDIYNAFNSDAATGYVNTYPQQNVARARLCHGARSPASSRRASRASACSSTSDPSRRGPACRPSPRSFDHAAGREMQGPASAGPLSMCPVYWLATLGAMPESGISIGSSCCQGTRLGRPDSYNRSLSV